MAYKFADVRRRPKNGVNALEDASKCENKCAQIIADCIEDCQLDQLCISQCVRDSDQCIDGMKNLKFLKVHEKKCDFIFQNNNIKFVGQRFICTIFCTKIESLNNFFIGRASYNFEP